MEQPMFKQKYFELTAQKPLHKSAQTTPYMIDLTVYAQSDRIFGSKKLPIVIATQDSYVFTS